MLTLSYAFGFATTVGNDKVLYQSEVAIRQYVSRQMKQHPNYRRNRRSRKTRYRRSPIVAQEVPPQPLRHCGRENNNHSFEKNVEALTANLASHGLFVACTRTRRMSPRGDRKTTECDSALVPHNPPLLRLRRRELQCWSADRRAPIRQSEIYRTQDFQSDVARYQRE